MTHWLSLAVLVLLPAACASPLAAPTPPPPTPIIIVVTATPAPAPAPPAIEAPPAPPAPTVPPALPPAPATPPTPTLAPAPSPTVAANTANNPAAPSATALPSAPPPLLFTPAPALPSPPPTPPSPTSARPAADWTLYTPPPPHTWTITYPRDLLTVTVPSDPRDALTIFISQDRGTVLVVDVVTPGAGDDLRGNTGEGLRNRARDMLSRVYGRPVNETGIIERPASPWQTGLTFSTALGSQGEAVYLQQTLPSGERRVYGVLYGFKSATLDRLQPLLQAARTSFTSR